VLDENIDYWGTHKIDFIPSRLLKRISELGKCKVISPSLAETYDMNIDFKEASRKSQSVYRVSTYFNSEFSELFSELLQNNVNVYFIASRELFNKLRMDNNVEFVKLINNGFFHFYVYPKEMDFMSFAYNDYYLILRLIKSNGEIDTKYVLSCNPDVVKWGKEIFDNYLKDSVTIDKSQLLFAEAVEVI
jgi:predicted transcriptional regulator